MNALTDELAGIWYQAFLVMASDYRGMLSAFDPEIRAEGRRKCSIFADEALQAYAEAKSGKPWEPKR